MNNLFTHSRDIYCYLSRQRLIYSIPLYFEPEKKYFKSQFLEIEICPNHKKEFVLTHGDLKSIIHQPDVKLLTNIERYGNPDLMGCCEKK